MSAPGAPPSHCRESCCLENAHAVRSQTCHKAHRVHILTQARHAGRSCRGVAAIHAGGRPSGVPSARGVHDHEKSISRLGRPGAILAASGPWPCLCGGLRDAVGSPDTVPSHAKGQPELFRLPFSFAQPGFALRCPHKRRPYWGAAGWPGASGVTAGWADGAGPACPMMPLTMVSYRAIGSIREEAIL